ncbi:MAG: DUF4115 domain-containing protein [Proteobacteria bacterium]|nr:DUF4115 domain-containing protein [Pseudomonadota bacterium]MDA1057487.1 DUF4115 domain-containing protein [Pseudomonadota bacterium]
MAGQDPRRDDYPPLESARGRLHLREVRSESGEYDGIGVELGAARIRAGAEVADIAQKLRISPAYLVAIEKGRFDDLPGHAYVFGFLKSYARFLKLDEDIVVERFRAETTGPRRETRLAFPSAMDRGRMPTGRLLMGGALLAVLAYASWFVFTSDERSTAERVAPIPERLVSAQGSAEARTAASEPVVPSVPVPRVDVAAVAPAVVVADPTEVARAVSEVQAVDPVGANPAASAAPVEPAIEVPQAAPEPAEPALGETPIETAALRPALDAEPPRLDAPPPTATAVEESVAPPAPVAARTRAADDVEIRQLVDASSSPIAADLPPPVVATSNTDIAAPSPAAPQVALQSADSSPPPLATPVDQAGSLSDGSYVPRVFGAGNENARVVLIAESDSWVQVRATSGELLLTRVLRSGDRYLVPDRPGLVLMTGNLGALRVTVDGNPIAPLGSLGVIGRDIPLDADLLARGQVSVDAESD